MRPMTLFHFVMPFGRILGTLGLSLGMLLLLWMDAAGAVSRIKDIATFEGVRGNMLVGYGLMVGLNGTGDSLSNSPFTKQSLIGMLERLGVNVRDDALKTDNVAAGSPTATARPAPSSPSAHFAGRTSPTTAGRTVAVTGGKICRVMGLGLGP